MNSASMRTGKIVLCFACFRCGCAQVPTCAGQTQSKKIAPTQRRIVIAASKVLDGTGRVLRNVRIVIDGERIIAVDTKSHRRSARVDYDLRGLTVLPGWIDSHVHITASFGTNGKNDGGGTPQEEAYRAASNAWVTLMAGFTTVQSVGSPADVPLRD